MKMKPLLVWAVLGAFGIALIPTLVQSFYPSVMAVVPGGTADGYMNYDFQSESYAATNVDWPVNLIWYNQGEIDAVKSWLDSHGWNNPAGGDAKHMYIWEFTNQTVPEWDGDTGMKTDACILYSGTDRFKRHTRLYAPTDSPYYDQLYDPALGYYILATAHQDHNHGGCGSGYERFGYSEANEDAIEDLADNYFYTYKDNPNFYLSNSGYGFYDWSGNHYHSSDGYATTIDFH